MGTPMHPWTSRMLEVLHDGEWHPMQQVLTEMAKEIPPAAAMQYSRTLQRRSARGSTREVQQRVRSGRFGLARKVLLDWKRAGRVDIDPPGWKVPDKRVRLVQRG